MRTSNDATTDERTKKRRKRNIETSSRRDDFDISQPSICFAQRGGVHNIESIMRLVILIAASACVVSTEGVSPSITSTTTRPSFVGLSAKAGKGKKSKKGSTAGGGGFASKSTSNSQGKVRSVSGYTGSGTKPLRVAANTFDAIRKKYGTEACSDLYVGQTLI